jgi:NADH-quinone oxidoreductase subunit L
MKLPLILLMLCTLVAGFLPFSNWIFQGDTAETTHINWQFSLLPLSLSSLGILLATYFFCKPSSRVADTLMWMGGIYRTSKNKFYIDEIYLWITKRVLFPMVGKPAAWFDKTIIDGTVNGVGNFVGSIYFFIRGMQSGKLQDYLLYFLAGIAAWMVYFIYIWK